MQTTDTMDTNLAARLEAVEKKISRINARNEISNLMSKYMYYHAAFRDDLILEKCWAMNREDIHLEDGASGVFVGKEHIRAYYEDRPNPPGKFIYHSIHTPVIEVAEDGKTAKGTWMLSGVESGMVPASVKNLPEDMFCKEEVGGNRVWAHWCWAKYGIDFICEEGAWKIWHLHCYALTRTPFDENWVAFAAKQTLAKQEREEKERKFRTGGLEAEAHVQPEENGGGQPQIKYIGNNGEPVFFPKPDLPTTFHWHYDGLTSTSVLQPVPPEPYDTFENTFEY